MKLLVWKDFSSSPLWVIDPATGARRSYDAYRDLGLPASLLDRLEFLSDWFESYEPGDPKPEPDWAAYHAYLIGVAIDLKRHFADHAQVLVEGKDGLTEITGDLSQMMRSSA